MSDGMINIDSPIGKKWGFTSDKFADSCLWKEGNDIILSMIISTHPGKGNLRNLIKNILDEGYGVKIPTPSNRMIRIAKKMGFVEKVEDDREMGRIDILYKKGSR